MGDYAFSECTNLKTAVFSEGITELSYCTFWQCSALTSVTLPSTLKAMGDYALYECPKLSSIYYGGSFSDWAAIRNAQSEGAKVYYSSLTAPGIKSVKAEAKYYIYRIEGGKSTKIGTTASTTYTDQTAKAGAEYSYRIKAYSSQGKTSEASASAALDILKAPKITKATTAPKIIWTKVDKATSYKIYRRDSVTGKTVLLKTVSSAKTSYTDKTAVSGRKYTYYVKAYNKTTKTYSAKSNTKTVTAK